jgi:hypothetical protein
MGVGTGSNVSDSADIRPFRGFAAAQQREATIVNSDRQLSDRGAISLEGRTAIKFLCCRDANRFGFPAFGRHPTRLKTC